MVELRRGIAREVWEEVERDREIDAACSDLTTRASDAIAESARTSRRGGKRAGAGRKKSGVPRGGAHRTRPELLASHPVHVTTRIGRMRPEMRSHHVYRKIHRVLRRMIGRVDFRVVHISIQNHHLHLLVEATNRVALSRGMQSLLIRTQRAICGSLGNLFTHRYHATQITTARQARNALAYVLNNWRRHRLDWDRNGRLSAKLDEFSSAIAFPGWRRSDGRAATFLCPAGYDPLPVASPQTWLLRVGWKELGLIDPFHTPGPL